MKDFQNKLDSIVPIGSISGIKSGKEWNQVSYYIKTKIVGRENYKKASEQKDIIKVHIIEMLDKLEYLSYAETAQLTFRVFSKIFSNDKLILTNINKVSYNTNADGEVEYFLDNEKVEICWCPSIECSDVQTLLPYDEYIRLLKMSSNENGKVRVVKNSTFSFEDIVESAFKQNASDIHITFSDDYYNVFFRIYGKLEKQRNFLMNSDDGEAFVRNVKIEAATYSKGEFNPDIHYLAQDAKLKYPNIGIDGVDVRLAFIPDGTLERTSLTARLLKREKLSTASFLEMGYDVDLVDRINIISKRQNGLVISSGITGSGKSTFIANIVANIDKNKRIYTIEDPVEYRQENPNITQHQVYSPKDVEKQMGFKEYTKSLKRGDPDVVNIGEMRNDPELTKSIMEMSEAGQLVLSTVHITSAFSIYGSLDKVFNISPDITVPMILFSVNQVLVDKLCPHCKQIDENNINLSRLQKIKDSLPYQYISSLTQLFEDLEAQNVVLYIKGKGCNACNHKGYVGRVPIYEYFVPNVTFMEWLLSGEKLPTRYAIEDKACRSGIGVNKLDVFCKRLRDGSIDASENVIYKIM